MVAGLVIPVVLAPLVVLGLRRLFAVFLVESVDLFGYGTLDRKDALVLGALTAKLNVVVLLVAWLGLYTCLCFHQSNTLLMAIALGGVLSAILVTTLIVRANLRLAGRTLLIVGLLVFAGGNLPLIVIAAVTMAIVG
jgi:hypothetical protein